MLLPQQVTAGGELRARPEGEALARPFRRTLEFNETVAGTYYDQGRLAPVFLPGRIQKIRVNGDIGLTDGFDSGKWHDYKPLKRP